MFSAQPLIDYNPKRILIGGRTGLPFNLFGGHVSHGPYRIRGILRIGAVSDKRGTKIAQQDFVMPANEHIARFYIAMNEVLVVRVLESRGNLFDIRDNGRQWN